MQQRPLPSSFAPAYMALLVIGAVLAGAAYWGILSLQAVPPVGLAFEEKQAAARLEALKVALTTVAGLAAVSGLYVTYRKQRTEEGNSTREQDRVFTERFANAATLLASDKSAVRLAGIQSLARLYDDSNRDSVTCTSMICSYLRLPVALQTTRKVEMMQLPVSDRENWSDQEEWDVRRNALKLLFERSPSPQIAVPSSWDLREATLIDADFSGQVFHQDIDLRNATFVGETRFNQVRFLGSLDAANCDFLSDVDMSRVAHARQAPVFDGSTFRGTFTYRRSCEWDSPLISLRGCHFTSDVTIEWDQFCAIVRGQIIGVEASSILLHMNGARLSGAVTLPTHGVDLRGADLSKATSVDITEYSDRYGTTLCPTAWDSSTKWPEGFEDASIRR